MKILWKGKTDKITAQKDGYKKVYFQTAFGTSTLTTKLDVEDAIDFYDLN